MSSIKERLLSKCLRNEVSKNRGKKMDAKYGAEPVTLCNMTLALGVKDRLSSLSESSLEYNVFKTRAIAFNCLEIKADRKAGEMLSFDRDWVLGRGLISSAFITSLTFWWNSCNAGYVLAANFSEV